jgi:CubicO group peptidase (beta-lactamase class C family)
MTLTPGDTDRIRGAMRDAIAQHSLPGLAVGVVAGVDVAFCEAAGFADIESRTPLTIERRQRIASITKTLVGLCAMALVDEGKLRLESRVTDLLPEVRFDGPAETITVGHLLTHTSGIGEAPTLPRLRDVANPDRATVDAPPGDFAALYPDGVTIEVPPGEKWAYCNNGYALLGEIVQRAAGRTLPDMMQRRIFAPLQMTSTDINDVDDARITSCYHRARNEDTRFQLERAGIAVKDETPVDGTNIRGAFTSEFNRSMRAAGGVQSTLPDMLKYAAALLGRGAGIVSPETFDLMVSPRVCPEPRLISWGLSFARMPLAVAGEAPKRWRMMFGHGGAYFGGWNSHIDVIPDADIAVVQHMNVMLDEPGPIFRAIIRAVLGGEQHPFEPRSTDPLVLTTAPGLYELPMPGPLTNFRPQTRVGRVQITAEDDRLVLRSRFGAWKHGVELIPCDPEAPDFFAASTTAGSGYVALDRDPSGRVTGLRFDDLVLMRRRS